MKWSNNFYWTAIVLAIIGFLCFFVGYYFLYNDIFIVHGNALVVTGIPVFVVAAIFIYIHVKE
ncbi:hypothetical protein [Kaarinaea lacus]